MLAAWALISIAYYGVFVYLPIKPGAEGFAFMRGLVFLVILAIVQLPGYALLAYGVERWGRKPTLIDSSRSVRRAACCTASAPIPRWWSARRCS